MKINKIRPKFHFSTKIEIKWLTLRLCFVIYCFFAARAIWKPFYRRLRFWVVLTVRKIERLGTLKPTVPARRSINPMKMVQTRQNWSLTFSSQPLAKRLILTFFHRGFLSRDTCYRALGRDVINGRSKLTSQWQFASVRGRAQCIESVIASSSVGGSLGPFDRDKARQNITRVPGYLHSTERPSSLLRLLLGVRYFSNSHRVWAGCVLTFFSSEFSFFYWISLTEWLNNNWFK